MGERLAHPHAVEGIAVVPGKFPDLHDRVLVEREAFDTVALAQLRQVAIRRDGSWPG